MKEMTENDVCKSGDKAACGLMLAGEDSLHRYSLYLNLVIERIQRKCAQIMEVHKASDEDWNQTLYTMIFRYLGGDKNQKAFSRLASVVKYRMCLKERSSLFEVEALLLGASGLLADDYYDDYAIKVRTEYDYLRNKHSIQNSMWGGEWETARIMPCNKPEQRIAQIAALVANREFMFDTVIAARSKDDIQRLFDIETSEYWKSRCAASGNGASSRLGKTKAYLLGINVVVPVMFAYAASVDKEGLKTKAFELLEAIPAEKNSIVSGWSGAGIPVESAFESQALIQLNNEYCDAGRCNACPLKMSLRKESLHGNQ